MYDKRFIKIKKVGDERYFRDNREFIKFIEKQGGRTWEEMCDIYIYIYSWLIVLNKRAAKRYWYVEMNLDGELIVIGDFLFRITRGYFHRTSGQYNINILAEQRSGSLSANDKDRLFNLTYDE